MKTFKKPHFNLGSLDRVKYVKFNRTRMKSVNLSSSLPGDL